MENRPVQKNGAVLYMAAGWLFQYGNADGQQFLIFFGVTVSTDKGKRKGISSCRETHGAVPEKQNPLAVPVNTVFFSVAIPVG